MTAIVKHAEIAKRVHLVRGEKVLLDTDLAELYGVTVSALKQAIRRNRTRFPDDFMIELSVDETQRLRSQSVILKRGAYSKYGAFAFTEQGVAMLSGVLKTKRAIAVNVEIMRTFVRLREVLATHTELAKKLARLESKYDAQFKAVFDAIRELMMPSKKAVPKIGFREERDEP
jgi:hypothetical protein